MLVPATTVPVTIIGAFAAMAALGFTVNFATLFALVLAIGIVVDDAIIVVEGAAHNIDHGMNGHDAAIEAMRVLLGPIIGITLVLLAVFLPAAFLPGLTGQMYAQFALVIAATALISAINAVTLKPTQCALWLRPSVPMEQRNAFYRGFNAVYDKLEHAYAALMRRLVGFAGIIVVVAIAHHRPHAVRIHAHRRPASSRSRTRATCWRRCSCPTAPRSAARRRCSTSVSELAQQNAGVEKVITIAGVSALDNNALARQCRRRLHHPQGLGRARQGARPAADADRPQSVDERDRRGDRARSAAAADPGHRLCRRLYLPGRDAGQQPRFRQARRHRQHACSPMPARSRACSWC